MNNCAPTWGIQILALDLLPVIVLRTLSRNPWQTLGKAKYLTSRRWRHYRRQTAIETCTICESLFPFLSANIINCQFYLDNTVDYSKQSLLKSVMNSCTFPVPPPLHSTNIFLSSFKYIPSVSTFLIRHGTTISIFKCSNKYF